MGTSSPDELSTSSFTNRLSILCFSRAGSQVRDSRDALFTPVSPGIIPLDKLGGEVFDTKDFGLVEPNLPAATSSITASKCVVDLFLSCLVCLRLAAAATTFAFLRYITMLRGRRPSANLLRKVDLPLIFSGR